jgi:hypothetical protein
MSTSNMSNIELAVEKIKSLSDDDAKKVVSFIDAISKDESFTAQQLMKLPLDERNKILAKQFERAGAIYQDNPELLDDVVDEPLDYD